MGSRDRGGGYVTDMTGQPLFVAWVSKLDGTYSMLEVHEAGWTLQ